MTEPLDPQGITPPAAMPAAVIPLSHFSYTAQTESGLRFNGTVEAPDGGAAVHILESMRLRVTGVTAVDKPANIKAVRDDPLLRFNQFLAELAQSGLPIEKSLRIVAQDVRRPRMARALTQISSEIETGVPLADAFDKHRNEFPPIYGRLLDAGVRGGNIPAVLLNLGRHLETQKRMRNILLRNTAQPMMTLCALLLIVGMISVIVMPRFRLLFADFRLELPLLTNFMFWFGGVAPYLALTALAIIAAFIILWLALRAGWLGRLASDRFLLAIPFIAPVLKFNLIARWLDAVRIGVLAGLELPAAIRLAGDAVASRALNADGEMLASAIAYKKHLSEFQFKLLPATVSATLEYSAAQGDLPDALQTLCDLYARQAEIRIERIPAIITPALFMLTALLIGLVIVGLLLPLVEFIRSITGGVKF